MTRIKSVYLTLFAVLLSPMAANADVIYTGPGATNVDTDPATLVDLVITDSGLLTDINVAVNITGGHMEDFAVFISHNGTTVFLIDPNVTGFGHRDIFDVIFDDASANVVTSGGDLIGDYAPLDLLSAFNGMDISGTWTLGIWDTYVPGEENSLVSWSIDVTTTAVPEPGILALLGIGLLGMGLSRRRKA